MYAIIETGGKQYRVQKGDVITVEKLNAEVGAVVTFDKVLVLGEGKDIKVGAPYVDQAVSGKVLENGKGKKVLLVKYKAKKDSTKKQGHRQPYTMVEITDLGVAAPKAAKKAEAPKAEAPKAAKEVKVSEAMKKDELIAYANEHGIKIDAKATKAVIVEAINSAE